MGNVFEKQVTKWNCKWESVAHMVRLVTCFHISYSIMKMEVVHFSETSVDFQRTTPHNVLERKQPSKAIEWPTSKPELKHADGHINVILP
jgi:hypothetical protein